MGFVRDVLGGEPWELQVEVAEAVLEEPRVTVRSCHAAGKDWLAARLSLWWVYARGGLVVLTGPTAAQVEEILMRGEVREAFRRSGLPGELHVRALRPAGGGRAGILAKTATGLSALTGFHETRVLYCITEAQDPDIHHAWDAAFACTTGEEDRILTLRNPTQRAGRFYRTHRPESEWRAVKIAAGDVPNVREGETVVPGLLSRQGVDRFASEYGEESGFYESRVLAEFPVQSEEGLFRREWLEESAERHASGELEPELGEEEPVCALDPARHGPDASVLAVREGPVLRGLRVWDRRESTSDLVARLRSVLPECGVRPRPQRGRFEDPKPDARGRIVVDEVGIGAGVEDRLSKLRYRTDGFNSGRQARNDVRFHDRRAEAFWTLRRLVEEGEVALPRDEELFKELLALRWRPNPSGKVQLERKKDLRSRIGRSPDRADAVAIAFAPRSGGFVGAASIDLGPGGRTTLGGRSDWWRRPDAGTGRTSRRSDHSEKTDGGRNAERRDSIPRTRRGLRGGRPGGRPRDPGGVQEDRPEATAGPGALEPRHPLAGRLRPPPVRDGRPGGPGQDQRGDPTRPGDAGRHASGGGHGLSDRPLHRLRREGEGVRPLRRGPEAHRAGRPRGQSDALLHLEGGARTPGVSLPVQMLLLARGACPSRRPSRVGSPR